MEALVSAANELCEQDAAAIDPLEASDLFLAKLKARLKGWKISDWDFLSRKAGTLEIDLHVKSPDGKIKKRPHANIETSKGKFSASFSLDRKGKKQSAKGSSLKDILGKVVAGVGNALSGLKEGTMDSVEESVEDVLSELLDFCTEKGIDLEAEDLGDLVEELEEWLTNSDLTEGDVSALGSFVERLKKMIFMMLNKTKKAVSDKAGELPGDAGDAGDDGEDDEQEDEDVKPSGLGPLISELKGIIEQDKWIQKAIKKPGALRKQLGVPEGEDIPKAKLKAAAEKGGKLGKRARLALTLSKFKKERVESKAPLNESSPGNIIWKQLQMTTKMAVGAREAVLTKKGIKFKVERKPFRYISIDVNSKDLYDVEYFRLKRKTYQKVSIKKKKDVPVENLNSVVYALVNK